MGQKNRQDGFYRVKIYNEWVVRYSLQGVFRDENGDKVNGITQIDENRILMPDEEGKDLTNMIANLLYQRFAVVDFNYDSLSVGERVWCIEEAYNDILRWVNQTRTKV